MIALPKTVTLRRVWAWAMASLSQFQLITQSLLLNDPKITSVNLANSDLDDTAVEILSNSLLSNDHCTSLNLSHNLFGTEGLAQIANLISNNSTLLKLNLSFNHLDSRSALALSNAISCSNSLKTINLQNCGPYCGIILMGMMRNWITWKCYRNKFFSY